jgi:hypothetical protein
VLGTRPKPLQDIERHLWRALLKLSAGLDQRSELLTAMRLAQDLPQDSSSHPGWFTSGWHNKNGVIRCLYDEGADDGMQGVHEGDVRGEDGIGGEDSVGCEDMQRVREDGVGGEDIIGGEGVQGVREDGVRSENGIGDADSVGDGDRGGTDNESNDDNMKSVEEESIGGRNDEGIDDEERTTQDVNEDSRGEDDEGEGDMEKDDEEEELEDTTKEDSRLEEDEEEDVEGIEKNQSNAKGDAHIGVQIHSTRPVQMKPTTQSFHRRSVNDAKKSRRSFAKVKAEKTIYDEVNINSKSFPVYIDLSGDVSTLSRLFICF